MNVYWLKSSQIVGAVSLNFDRKKRLGSKPELPVLDNVPKSKIGAIYLTDAASPISKYYETKKLEPKNNEIVPASGALHTLDVKVIATSLFSHPLQNILLEL
jgi:hypothetical protein